MSPNTLYLAPMGVEERALRKGGIPQESIVRIGMGRGKSLAAVEQLRSRPFDRLVIAGVCGSLDSSFRPGDVLIPSQVSATDVGTTECTVDGGLVEALRAAGLTVRSGTLVSHTKLESNKKAVKRHETTGAVGVDMESAWLATLASDQPVIVVRVASDSPDKPVFHPGVLYWGAMALRRLATAARVLRGWDAGG
jgi:4-hydroxy-3-methylbut-2-enyl diphosphate reductase